MRKEGLSNGMILEKSKRLVNFETSDYEDYFEDLRHDNSNDAKKLNKSS